MGDYQRVRPRVFVTQPLAGTALDRLRAAADVEVNPDAARILPKAQLLDAMAGCDVLCCLLHDRIDAEVIDAAPRLRLISNGAISASNVDVTHAQRRGIPVALIPNIVAETTADLQWALLLAVARRIVEADRGLRKGLFPGSQSLHFAGADIHAATLGTIGLGAIGLGTARRARGFGMRVLYTKRRRLTAAEEAAEGVAYRSLEQLLQASDFVVLNAAYTPQTHHLIGAHELALMKPTAYFVNTARGPMVDEAALAAALRAGRIAGAGLDVFEDEPRVHPDLLSLENVVLTPHIGSATLQTRAHIADCIVANVLTFLKGDVLPRVAVPPDR